MDTKKIYGILIGSMGLIFVTGALIISYQDPGYTDKQTIIVWGSIFLGLGLLSFFWDKFKTSRQSLRSKIAINHKTKDTGFFAKIMAKYYQATESPKAVTQAELPANKISKRQQKRRKRSKQQRSHGQKT